MSWLTNFVLPKIRAVVTRKAVPDNLWHKCPGCEQMLFYRELEANLHVCRNCGHHLRIGAERRLKWLFDDGAYTRIELPRTPVDPLRFRDRKRYTDRLKEADLPGEVKPEITESRRGCSHWCRCRGRSSRPRWSRRRACPTSSY